MEALNKGQFENAMEYFKKAQNSIKDLKSRIPEKFDDLSRRFSMPMCEEGIYAYKYNLGWELYQEMHIQRLISFVACTRDVLYLGDVKKAKELLEEAKEMLDKLDEFIIGDVKFFRYILEFLYLKLRHSLNPVGRKFQWLPLWKLKPQQHLSQH